ncbi:MAG: hypothetical protein H7Y10_03440 [Flavobacterium sp.]|nr:hypothetical protein [Flavobacterium sp.]
MTQQIKLTAIFVERIYTKTKQPKLVSSTKTEHKQVFFGKSKSDCKKQAKENFRTGVEWLHEWN